MRVLTTVVFRTAEGNHSILKILSTWLSLFMIPKIKNKSKKTTTIPYLTVVVRLN